MGNLSPCPEKARAAAADSALRITASCQHGERDQSVSEIAAREAQRMRNRASQCVPIGTYVSVVRFRPWAPIPILIVPHIDT